MEIQGKLKQVLPEVVRKDFKSRKVWIETAENPEYPQTIELEVSGKSLDIFNGVSIGAPVVCHVNLRGREWISTDNVNKVFNTIQCWRVEAAAAVTSAPVAQQSSVQSKDITAGQYAPPLDDSLPF